MKRLINILVAVMVILFSQIAMADDITFFVGKSIINSDNDQKGAFAIMYQYQLPNEHFFLSGGYLNEGPHFDNHRDGFMAQGWISQDVIKNKLSINVGIGPYYYFDTHKDGNIERGLALDVTAMLAYDLDKFWSLKTSFSRIQFSGSNDADLFLFGIGYKF